MTELQCVVVTAIFVLPCVPIGVRGGHGTPLTVADCG